ncbi:MAG TPA: TorF family putative porin [Caulobacteraceae bacterium]|nr:TorF family putative porin [Caulobacteraceae bacterium]
MRWRLVPAVGAGAAMAASFAFADDPAPAPAQSAPCAGIYLAASADSDYRFDGFSESDRQPTWRVNIHCYRNDGWYAGAVFTGVKFLDTPPTHFEMDLYAGKRFQLRGMEVNLELLDVTFPDQRNGEPSYGLFEAQGELSRAFGRLTMKTQAAVSPNYSGGEGSALHLKAMASYALTPWLSLSATGGRLWISRGPDRDHWDAGVTAFWRRLTLDARYGGTDLKPAQCYDTNWCAPGASITLTFRVLP